MMMAAGAVPPSQQLESVVPMTTAPLPPAAPPLPPTSDPMNGKLQQFLPLLLIANLFVMLLVLIVVVIALLHRQ
jgi:hypothetical protein